MGSLCKGIRCFLKLHSGSHPFVPYINDLPDDAVLVLMSILMILWYTVSTMGFLCCGKGQCWLLNLNLTWNGVGSGLLISVLAK